MKQFRAMRIPIISTKFTRNVLAAMGVSMAIQGTALAQFSVTETTNVGALLPDLVQNVTSIIDVSSAPPNSIVTTVSVSFSIRHQYPADLRIDLVAEDGTRVNLDGIVNPPPGPNFSGGPLQNYQRTVEGISVFQGQDVNQAFTMAITDELGLDSGIWDSWSITVNHLPPGLSLLRVSPTFGFVQPSDLVPTSIVVLPGIPGQSFDPDNVTVTMTGPAGAVDPWPGQPNPTVFVQPPQITLLPRLGNNPGEYTIMVDDGVISGSVVFSLRIPLPAISSIVTIPGEGTDPFPADGMERTFRVTGINFDNPGQALSLVSPGGDVPISGQIISTSDSEIVFTHTFSPDEDFVPGEDDQWIVLVTTDGGNWRYAFTVSHPMITPPTLDIEKMPGNMVLLSWPNTSNWILNQTSTGMTGSWTPVPGNPVDNGTDFTITLPVNGNGTGLFRLEQP